MEILAAIAGKLAEFTVAPIGRQVGYLAHYKSNHQKLQTNLEYLSAARDEVQYNVDRLERRGKTIEPAVLNWKTRVDAIITRAETFLIDGRHAQTECLHGFCPHLVLRYQLSKKSTKLVMEIDELYGKKEFPRLAFDSRNSIVTSVMDELRNPNTEMILVWGIGGVGKTTLVEEVLRQAKFVNLFDDVVMVRDVKEKPDLVKIQKEIATRLGMSIDENHTLAERASILCDRIKHERTLVVLDDVWEKIDLLAVGLPRLVTCKVVLTCRSRKELSCDMRKQTDISLDVLDEEEAWNLFEKMAGDVVKYSGIRSVAIEVAKTCGGLPVLIVTVARALKDRNELHHWNDTLRCLRGFDKKELTEKAYLTLEWSYNQLKGIELKPLFLLSGSIVVENHIYLVDLLRYAFGLGLIRNINTIEEARDALAVLVDRLKDSCLLLDSDINMYVRMHDLVCEVATQIASRDQHVLSIGYGGELKEWPDKDFLNRCRKMSLKSSNIPMLSEVSGECQELEMFSLYSESVVSMEIPSNFFSETEKLKVLDFTKVSMLSLPSSLQFLKNVQMLCLEECVLEEVALIGHLSNLEILSFARSNIKKLPKEIGRLIRLGWLDLSDCAELEVISPDVISRLERLEDLTMRNIFLKWEAERGGSNASLLELKDLSQLTGLEIYIQDADILPSNLFSSKLVRYQISIGDVWMSRFSQEKKTMAESPLNMLKLKLTTSNEMDRGIKMLLRRSEDLSLDGTESVNSIVRQLDVEDFVQLIHLRLQNNVDFTSIINRKGVFPNLTTLSVSSCDHLRFLFSVSMARSLMELKHLEVSRCERMEEIVSTRDQSNGENISIMFCKLECLTLVTLPNLARFSTGSCIEFDTKLGVSIDPTRSKKLDVESGTAVEVEFPSLERLTIIDLPKLKTIWHTQLAPDSILHAPSKLLTPARQSSILINENSIPNLKYLTLIPMDIWYYLPISAVCCERAVFAGISNRHTDASLPHLRTLRLHGILDMRLWQNTKPAGQNSPQLEILQVKFSRLNNLELSSLSFQNLTILEVTFCWRLQYLTTYSVARSLRLLRKLKVDECKSMKQILASEGIGEDDSNCEIVFSQLQHLELSDLISLECFCSSNCTVKVPTLETLEVKWCSIELKVSSGILEVDSNMHLDVQKSHSRKEAFNTTESACSSEKTQKQPVTNSSEEAEHIEFNARELHDDSRIERLEEELRATKEELRAKKADIRRLEEELRAKKAERRDHSALQ